jgi:DNA-binding transcriptional MerR regulator
VNARRLTIGQLAKSFGIATSAIRYYEASGLLPLARRSGSGYREYTREDGRLLQMVVRGRSLGMELPEIRELVKFASTGTCDDFRGEFRSKVTERLKQVDRSIDRRSRSTAPPF